MMVPVMGTAGWYRKGLLNYPPQFKIGFLSNNPPACVVLPEVREMMKENMEKRGIGRATNERSGFSIISFGTAPATGAVLLHQCEAACERPDLRFSAVRQGSRSERLRPKTYPNFAGRSQILRSRPFITLALSRSSSPPAERRVRPLSPGTATSIRISSRVLPVLPGPGPRVSCRDGKIHWR
jgi:hypothetical protein